MFSVYSKNKGIGLTVPILLEGSVYIYILGVARTQMSRFGTYLGSIRFRYNMKIKKIYYARFLDINIITCYIYKICFVFIVCTQIKADFIQ